MLKKLRANLIIILILAIAAFLRFYQLGSNPPGMDWDETAHGYNAYSILKTGKDEYGYKFPLSFRSFDDYKPPLYTYMVVPSVAAFGLNNFAVRFPSALLGVFAVLFTYLMVWELLKNKQIALFSALFLAISPWHLQFSRVAFETNTIICWTTLATWTFLRGVKSSAGKITAWFTVSALAFGADMFTYHNARVFAPLYSLMLLFLAREKLLKIKKYLVIPLLITMAFCALLVPIIFSVSGQLRFKGTTIFADQSPVYKASALIEQDKQQGSLVIGKILHNRRFVYLPILIDNYLSHFRPTFLFLTADAERHHAPEIGLLYLWDLPFILCGVYFLLKNNFDKRSKLIIFWWFLMAPVAASVTWGLPHSLRSEIYLPVYQIFAAVGVYTLYSYSKKKRLFASIAAILLFFNFAFYLHQYYVHMPIEFSRYWLYGRKEAAIDSWNLKDNYDRVIVSTKVDQPHEFWLYYLKYDPKKYLAQGGTVSGGFLEDRNRFDKFQFKPIDYQKQSQEAKTLFVGTPQENPGGTNVIKKIHYLNGEPAIYIWD